MRGVKQVQATLSCVCFVRREDIMMKVKNARLDRNRTDDRFRFDF